MKCKACNAEIEEGTLFCTECGARAEDGSDNVIDSVTDSEINAVTDSEIDSQTTDSQAEEKKEGELPVVEEAPVPIAEAPIIPTGEEKAEQAFCFCTNCGSKVALGSSFCESCGTKMEVEQNESADSNPTPSGSSHKKSRLPLIVGGVAAIAVLAAVVALPKAGLLGGGSKSNLPTELLYVKDESLYGASLKGKKEPVEYTDNFVDNTVTAEIMDRFKIGYKMISKDGKYHFIIEDISVGSSRDITYSLLYRKGNKEPVKIDSDIEGRYRVTDDNKVIYKKNGNLYVSDLKEKKKIDSDVSSFSVDKAGKNILWFVDSGNGDSSSDIYYQGLALKKDKIKITTAQSMLKSSGDLNTLLLLDEGSVYLVRNQGEKEKLVSDVEEVFSIDLDKGTFFYTTAVNSTAQAVDFVEDDMAVADSQLTEPNRANYERKETAGNGVFSYTKTVVDDKYKEDMAKYREKLNRDNLREQLKETTIESPYTELYCFSNGEKTLVTDSFRHIAASAYITENDKKDNGNYTSYLIYAKSNLAEMNKIKLSEIGYASEVEYLIDEAKNKSITTCLFVNGVETELNLDDKQIDTSFADAKTNKLYALVFDYNADYSKGGDLISINLSGSDVGSIETKDSDVESIEILTGQNLYYLKDINDNGVGDLYCNSESVLSDVSRYNISAIPDSDAVLCLADPNKNNNRGTLTFVNGQKTEKIADDVNEFNAFATNSIAMMTEYNYDRYKGDLKYYNGKETKLIDTDVCGFFHSY